MSYLVHHGILGQRWGVRRFQNEDGSLTAAGRKRYGNLNTIDADGDVVIEKGSTISSVSTTKKIKLDERGVYGYDANDEVDKSVYEGAYSTYLRWYRDHSAVFKHTFVNSEDLVLPSHKKKVDTFMDLLSTDEEFKKSYEQFEKEYALPQNDDDYDTLAYKLRMEKKRSDFLKNAGMTSLKDYKYQRFIHGFNQSDLMVSASKKFVDRLSSMGYNAMIDDNNAGVYNKANSPLYVFNGQKSLRSVKGKTTSKGKKHSDSDIRREADNVRRRNGGNIAL